MGQETKNQPPQQTEKLVATQKTFRFFAWKSPAKIDEQINAWLLMRSKDGTPAQLGKVTIGKVFIYYVFLYSRKVALK